MCLAARSPSARVTSRFDSHLHRLCAVELERRWDVLAPTAAGTHGLTCSDAGEADLALDLHRAPGVRRSLLRARLAYTRLAERRWFRGAAAVWDPGLTHCSVAISGTQLRYLVDQVATPDETDGDLGCSEGSFGAHRAAVVEASLASPIAPAGERAAPSEPVPSGGALPFC
jgi:hypothetical protein